MNSALMLAGLVLGLSLGLWASLTGSSSLEAVAMAVAPLGDVFIQVLNMVVIPLVMALVFSAMARMGDLRRAGYLGGTALAFIWGTTILAILLGMGVMRLALAFFESGTTPDVIEMDIIPAPGIVDFLVGLVPANPFAAAAGGQLLQLLLFSVLFGAATASLETDLRERLTSFADAVSGAFVRLVHWILVAAPVGIFGLAAPAAARMGLDLVQSLAVFVGTVIVALAVFVTCIYLPLVFWIGEVGPRKFIRETLPSFIMGFTTTSGMPTLPVLLRDAPALGVSERVRDLVIPLAVPLNRAGSALFQGAAVVFVAWLYEIPIPAGAWAGAVVATFFAAAAVAPIPSASVMTLAPALSAVGAPIQALGMLLAVDRIPDMFRTGTNMTGHMAAAVVTQRAAGDELGAGVEANARQAELRAKETPNEHTVALLQREELP